MKKNLMVLMAVLLALSVSTVFANDVEQSVSDMTATSNAVTNGKTSNSLVMENFYQVWCYKPDGTLRWYDEVKNLVPEAGLSHYISATVKGGAQSTVWYVGLVAGPGSGTTYADADTLAVHGGWTEDITSYTGNRPTFNTSAAISCTGSGICSLDNSANKAAFTIDATCAAGCNVGGALLCNLNTGTGGILLGAGDFTGGDRTVYEADTLNVQITVTVAKP